MSGSARHVCLFAQYHPRRRLRPPLLHYLRSLRDCGYAVFVASSGPGAPPAADRDALAETGATLLCRANAGLDFGAWQHLIRQGCADGAERVLLANDSVFGPFGPLAPLIARMEAGGYDAWGMIESRQRGWHLQSWFIQFSGDAFRHEAVRRVFALPFASMSKDAVIAQGEIGLGAAVAGLRCGAVVRHDDGNWLARRYRINMMHLDWRHNLVALGLPFIKAELLRENPMRVPWIPAWEAVLRGLGADPGPISDYLFDYTGTEPAAPGARFQPPVLPLSIRLYLGYLLTTHDRSLALRYLRLRHLRLRIPPS